MTLIDKAEALDPCPFCGGSKLGKTTHGLPMAPCVICRDCYASAPSVAAWNRRAAIPARVVEPQMCGKCMGSGYGGHPDSGVPCADCKGSGGILALIGERT